MLLKNRRRQSDVSLTIAPGGGRGGSAIISGMLHNFLYLFWDILNLQRDTLGSLNFFTAVAL